MNFLRRFRRRRNLSWEEEFGAGRSASLSGGLYRARGHSNNPVVNFWNTTLGWEADPWDNKLIARKAAIRSGLAFAIVLMPTLLISFLFFRGDAYAESYGPPSPAGVWGAAVVPYELPDAPVSVKGANLSLRQIGQMRESFAAFFTSFEEAQLTGNHDDLRNLLTPEFYEVIAASLEEVASRERIRVYGVPVEMALLLNIETASPNNDPIEAFASLDGQFLRYEKDSEGQFVINSEDSIYRFEVNFVRDGDSDQWLISNIGLFTITPVDDGG